jgi:hypothetical protein
VRCSGNRFEIRRGALVTQLSLEANALILTTAIFEHEVRESPDVSQSDGVVDARQDELQLAGPSSTLLPHVTVTTVSSGLNERLASAVQSSSSRKVQCDDEYRLQALESSDSGERLRVNTLMNPQISYKAGNFLMSHSGKTTFHAINLLETKRFLNTM